MARLRVKFRRRNENRTDYKARLAMLKSNQPRLVIRKSNNYIIAEIITSKNAQDSVVCYVNSKELQRFGWKSSCKNLPASYLSGFLIGIKAKKSRISKAILDIGIEISTKGSRIYAVLKGALDAGLDIHHSKEIIPSDDRIRGKHIKDKFDIEQIKERIISS